MADKHMGHGSQVVYITHPVRSMVPRDLAAARIALTSACAVGSVSGQTVLCVHETTLPFFTTAAPNGDFPLAMPSRVLATACCMKSLSDMASIIASGRRTLVVGEGNHAHRD